MDIMQDTRDPEIETQRTEQEERKRVANMLRHAKRLARKVLNARDAETQAKKDIDEARADLPWLAEQLGMDVIEAVPGRGVQIVRPMGRALADEAKTLAAIARYRPDMLDQLAPATRKVDMSALSKAIENGDVPATWRRHIVDTTGTVQLRAVEVK